MPEVGMSEDSYWSDARGFLRQHVHPGEKLIAPVRLKKEFEHLYSYSYSYGSEVDFFDWMLIHKGMIEKFDHAFLTAAVKTFKPIFANEVFVILAKQDLAGAIASPHHLKPLLDALSSVNPQPDRSWLKRVKDFFHDNSVSQKLDLTLKRLASLDTQVKQIEKRVQGKTRTFDSKAIATLSHEEFVSLCRAACQSAYLGNGTILCRVLSRYLMYVDSQDISLAPHLLLNGYWEPAVTFAFARSIQPGWNCIDVGANHGYFSLLMASMVGKTGKVLALEPNTNLVQLIQQTLIVNGLTENVTVSSQAAADTNGEAVTLAVPKGQIGGASIVRQVGAGDDAIATETVTIDRLTADWEHVDFIKIDTEGAEESVWRGMRQTLQHNPHIIVVLEFGATRYPDGKAFLQEILNEGFILRYIDGSIEHGSLTVEQCLTERGDKHWDLYLSRY
ncbi:MAG: FkbM family methyltransferase [Timaviella obliquedivisa GSE-PSE-MK23-08B]|jgi:FkbM family methyltransferase|nr:FkbM family methyltransferase [Timaviella obliquedivisa GSE-PSE-MK23-08B]